MFLRSYKPRSLKIEKPDNRKYIRYFIMLLTLTIIFFVFFNNNAPMRKETLNKEIFQGTYDKTENLVKINKAKLVGINSQNRPYTITAEKAINEKTERNIFYLYNVAADISRINGSWLIINTKVASYNVKSKTFTSNEEVEIFYDDGSSLSTSNMTYNFKKGLLTCNDGIVMFGKWGTLTAGNFIYNEDLVKILQQIITKKGIINIGGKKQSVYDFVKKTKKDIKKNKLNKNTNLPLNQTMNLSLLNKILKK